MGANTQRQVLLEGDRDFRIARDDADPRGWKLICGDGSEVGKVSTLIIDTVTLKVSHLLCTLVFPRALRVALPASFARLDPEGHRVIYDTLFPNELPDLPEFTGVPVSAEDDHKVQCLLTNDDPTQPVPQRPVAPIDRRQEHRRND